MSAKTYLRILQAGLIASLLIVFLIFKDLLFPYITSKQLAFNVLTEFLLAIWLVFILRYPEYRPKRNYITWGLIAYFVAIFASCAVSVDLNLSFWGDAERMLGLFHLLHFLIFYLILITVFRSWSQWWLLLLSSVAVATIISLIGLVGAETYSTIGNTSYVSGYLIFNIFFSLLLFSRSKYHKWRWLYFLPILIMFKEFWACHTSGAIIGLFLSFLLLFFLLGLFHINKNVRRSSLVIFLAAVIGVIIIFSQYQSAWFQNSFLRNLTSQKATFQTRLISWRGAAADFKNHWLFGTGFGNYAIIFDRNFDSKFFDYAKTETYFDRAHNNLVDIASTTGLVGFLTYLSIFAAVAYYLISLFRKNGSRVGTGEESGQRNLEILLIVALLAAYFIQNLAVFDSFVTYIGLMIILGFIYWLFAGQEENIEEIDSNQKYFLAISRSWEWTALILLILGTYLFTAQFNIKPWRMFQRVIAGYSDMAMGNYAQGISAYKQALVGTPLDRDGAVTFINTITSNPNLLDSLTADQAQAALDYMISLAQKNVSFNPQDSLMQMQLAQAYDTAARFYYQDLDKFNYYSRQSIEAMDFSIENSPGRAPVYLVKAQMQLFRGESEEAIKTTEYAISLNTNYPEGYCRLAQFYMFIDAKEKKAVKDDKKLGAALTKCVDLGGVSDINSGTLLITSLNYFTSNNDYLRALKLAERLAFLSGDDAKIWLNLGKLYLIAGDITGASTASARAFALDKTLKADWANFVKTLTTGSSSPETK